MIITKEAIQINLEPEKKHEENFLRVLKDYSGEITIHNGVDVGMCQGNYMRIFQQECQRTTTITIRQNVELP